MAQLVERTLGKGEVPSSTLGISTIEKTKPCSYLQGFLFLSGRAENLAVQGEDE